MTGKLQKTAAFAIAFATIVWAAVFGLLAVFRVLVFDGFEADGPFQLFNPLRRIAAGQHGGVDFQFFHGLGIPYLHYPLFRILGGSIFASEFTRQLLSPIAFSVTLYLFFHLVTKDRRATLLLSACAIALLSGNIGLFMPGGSLLAIRSAMPVAVVALMFLELAPVTGGLLTGLTLGAALWLGIEQGLAITVAWFAVQGFAFLVRGERPKTTSRMVAALFALAATTLILHAAPGGWNGMLATLRYELKIVPAEQFWYFGVPPNDFVSRWSDFPIGHPRVVAIVLAALLAWFIALGAVARTRERLALPLATLLTYGLISSVAFLGIAAEIYFDPLQRAMLLALLAFAFVHGRKLLADISPRFSASTLASIAMIFVAIYSTGTISMYESLFLPPLITEWRATPPTLHPRLGNKWKRYLAQSHAILNSSGERDRRVWSTYAGLLESDLGQLHPSFDYIIHALGPENRARYLATFLKLRPPVVQTLRRKFAYEEWLEDENWDLYEEVLRHYRVIGETGHSVFWKRDDSQSLTPLADVSTDVHGDSVTIPLPPKRDGIEVAIVELTYSAINPWRRVPFAGGWPRYLVSSGPASMVLPVSLPPYRTTWRFPVRRDNDGPMHLTFSSPSLLPSTSLVVSHVHVDLVAVPESSSPMFYYPTPNRHLTGARR